jgi:3-isopropylmalate/(R)-2-methylmalate dehydratase small subunit
MLIRGRVWKFGNDIDTDAIIPARYLNTSDPKELAKHLMEDADKDFISKAKAGDLIVAGKKLRLRLIEGTCADCHKGGRYPGRCCEEFRKDFYRNASVIGLPSESPERLGR